VSTAGWIVSSTGDGTGSVVHWVRSLTNGSGSFGTETWKILGSWSSVGLLGTWDKDGFTTSSGGGSTNFTDEETHSTPHVEVSIDVIARSEDVERSIGVNLTVSRSSLRRVDPAFNTGSSTLNDNLNLVSTSGGPERSHSEGEDSDVLLSGGSSSSHMEFDTSVDSEGTIVGTFVGISSRDWDESRERITDGNTGSTVSNDVGSGHLDVEMKESLDGWSAGSGRSDLEEHIDELLVGRTDSTSTSEGSHVSWHIHDVGNDELSDGLDGTGGSSGSQRVNWVQSTSVVDMHEWKDVSRGLIARGIDVVIVGTVGTTETDGSDTTGSSPTGVRKTEVNHTGWSTRFLSLSSDTSGRSDTGSSTSLTARLTDVRVGGVIDGVIDGDGEGGTGLESGTVEPDVELGSRSISYLSPWEFSLGIRIGTHLIFVTHDDPDVDVLVDGGLFHGVSVGSSSSTNARSVTLSSEERGELTESGSLAGTINLGGESLGSPFDGGRGLSRVSVNLEGTGQGSVQSLDRVGGQSSEGDGLTGVVESELPTEGKFASGRDGTDVDTSELVLTELGVSVEDTVVEAVTSAHTVGDKGGGVDSHWVSGPSGVSVWGGGVDSIDNALDVNLSSVIGDGVWNGPFDLDGVGDQSWVTSR
jgi:hypothetical protein